VCFFYYNEYVFHPFRHDGELILVINIYEWVHIVNKFNHLQFNCNFIIAVQAAARFDMEIKSNKKGKQTSISNFIE
jgi:hypothetical protein